MTRRERMERRAERRREWAASREAKVASVAREADKYRGDVAFNTQPGHIPERARLIARQERAFEHAKMAEQHRGAAAGIEQPLARSIFSDDDNAAEALEAKAASIDAEAERWKALGAAWRKRKAVADPGERLRGMVSDGLLTEDEAVRAARGYAIQPYHGTPWPGYHLTNLRANARRCRERIEAIRRDAARRKEAEAAPGGVLVKLSDDGAQASITFPDYPGRETVAALKAAGFWWSRPSWYGPSEKLPACVREMASGD